MTKLRLQQLIIFVGSLGYVGFVPMASGTVTVALIGVPVFYLMHGLSWIVYLTMCVVFTLVAVWISSKGDEILGEKDSSKMVVDEIAGYMVAVFSLPFTWQIVLASFLLERAIDIVKVPPANIIERKVPAGWGVVLDDIVAGLYTLAIMKLLIYFQPAWWVA